MKFFKESAPMPQQTGTDVLREALRIRIKKGHAGPLARDLNIGVAVLEEFAHGKGKLPDPIMNGLAKDLFGDNCSFDAERNLLKRTPAPSMPPPALPPAFKAKQVVYSPFPPVRSDKPAPAQPKVRAGWAD